MTIETTKNPNIQAFFKTIWASEGVATGEDPITKIPLAYTTLFGGTEAHPHFFDPKGWHDHPRIKVPFGHTTSDAAGAYQIMSATFDDLRKNSDLEATAKKNNLPLFHPTMQDYMACLLISRRDGLNYVVNGHFEEAIAKCSHEWASFPNSGYGQHENQLADLEKVFITNGGNLNELG